MNTRLEQDAADALQGYESMAQYIEAQRARWARAQERMRPCTGVWAPTMGEQQKQAQAEYIKQHKCPF